MYYGGSKPKTVTDPGQAAFLYMQRLTRQRKCKWGDLEEEFPEEIRIAKAWKSAYSKAKDKRYIPKRKSFAPLEKLSWLDVLDSVARYHRLKNQGVTRRDLEAIEGDAECAAYYNRVMAIDRAKRREHPDIRPLTLGGDPRVRQWPSGKPEYTLTYYTNISSKRRRR